MEDGHVVVIGSAGIDIKGRPLQEPLSWGVPNLGRVRNSVGGVARNIAENLARLEVPVTLLTAIGNDAAGHRVLRTCERAGIDCRYAQRVPGARTGTYMALLHPDGQLNVALSDFEIGSYIDTSYITAHEHLVQDANLIVIDATLSEDALATVFELAQRYEVRVAADPTTPSLAEKLCPYIPQLYFVTPNASELRAMCGVEASGADRDTAIQAARQMVSMGAEIVVVTLGAAGLAYAHSGGGGFIRAIQTKVVDSTGAGDAFSGAAIFGLLNDVPLDEAMRLGITAASMTIASKHTVLHNLSQEMLYDNLMV
jgi:pseudouridine kinase